MPECRGPVLFLGLVLACAPAGAQPLVFNTEEWAPYNYMENGRVAGTSTDIVRLVAKNADIDYETVLGPWNRSYNTALNHPGNCVFSTVITDERKPLFKWVAPIERTRLVLFKLRGNSLTATSLSDVKNMKIGSYKGSVEVKYLEARGLTVEEAPADYVNASKLKSGRIDLWATADTSVRQAREAGVEIEPALVFSENDLGLACNLATDDAVIAKLQAALDAINASGEADKIRQSKF